MGKRINVGIIGLAGWIGKVHAQAYRRIPLIFNLNGWEVNLRYAADIEGSLIEPLAQKYGFAKWTTDWHQLVEDKQIDIVDIASPIFLHKEMVIEAARNGKHIMCEKPLSMSPDDAEEMIREVEKANVKHMINFNYRRVPGIAYMKSLIDVGEIGRPLLYRAFFGQEFGLNEAKRKGMWQFDASKSGGGSFVTIGPHVIDMARYLIGEIKEVVAVTSFLPDEERGPNAVEDQTIVLLKFVNGAIGSIISSWIANGRMHHFEFEVNTEGASFFFDEERFNEIQAVFEGDEEAKKGFRTIFIGDPHPYGADFGLHSGMAIGFKETFVIQFYEFIRNVIHGMDTSPDFYDGWFVQQVIDKAYASARSGHWEKIPTFPAIES